MAAYDHRVVPPPEMPPTPPVVPDGGGGSSSTALTTTGGAVGVPGSLIKTTPEEDAVKREQKMRNDEEARRTRLRGLFKEVITKTCDAMREHVRNSNLEEDVVDDLQQQWMDKLEASGAYGEDHDTNLVSASAGGQKYVPIQYAPPPPAPVAKVSRKRKNATSSADVPPVKTDLEPQAKPRGSDNYQQGRLYEGGQPSE